MLTSSVHDGVTPGEWEQCVALAAVYRLVAHFRGDDLMSAPVPSFGHQFPINP
jgi:hypothetical protein